MEGGGGPTRQQVCLQARQWIREAPIDAPPYLPLTSGPLGSFSL